MASSKFQAVAAPVARTMIIIWAAFLAAPFVYLVVGWILSRNPRPEDAAQAPVGVLTAAFLLVGTALVAASFALQRRALGDAALKAVMGPGSSALLPPGAGDLEPVEQRLARLLPHYQTTLIKVLAMREALAILGLVLVVLTGNFLLMVPWAVAAVGLITTQPPRVRELVERATPLARSLG